MASGGAGFDPLGASAERMSATETAPDTAAPATGMLLRATAYVCMTPAAWASPAVLQQRQYAFEYNLTSTHWPHEFVQIGAVPHHLPRNDPSRLSPHVRSLIGYDRGE